MKYKNLTVIGTSHISPESLKEVEKVILAEAPNIVALELDRKRFSALMCKKGARKVSLRDIKHVGMKGFIFSALGAWVEQKLGQKTGVSPGSEMILAYRTAQNIKARVALIDQDIEVTLKRFSQELSWKEKWYFIVDVFKGIILRKPETGFDISKVPTPATVSRLIKKIKKRYPNIYKVLVTERNEFMANNLAGLLNSFPDKKIVAVVGAGHEKEIIDIVKEKIKQAETRNI